MRITKDSPLSELKNVKSYEDVDAINCCYFNFKVLCFDFNEKKYSYDYKETWELFQKHFWDTYNYKEIYIFTTEQEYIDMEKELNGNN